MDRFILALDQGTTSSRAIVFDQRGQIIASSQREFPQLLPSPGHVEHDPEDIWASQLDVAHQALRQAEISAEQVAAIGVTNQRETTLLWERETGRPVGNAIVWQSRISAPICRQLRDDGLDATFRRLTGLVVDPYFSGTKIKHLLDADSELRARANNGEILFGTVDSFLVWRLTGGRRHVTDASNASRTLLFNIHTCQWDDTLLEILDIPRAILPEVVASSGVCGDTDEALFGAAIPIAGLAGDQQAATFGQACFSVGSAKNTFGTGSFLLMNTGTRPVMSQRGLLTTVGWSINGQTTYCLEGSVFVSGAVIQWLRDGLGLIEKAADVEPLARQVPDSGGVIMVPAFVGLGAPHWDPYARGMVIGITRGTTRAHLARAALEAMAFQTRDLVEAMQQDAEVPLQSLNVDGGAAANDLLLQIQADLLQKPVRRPVVWETTALGAAYLAGLAVDFWSDETQLATNWQLDQEFRPSIDSDEADHRYKRWQNAIARCRDWEEPER